MTALLKKDSLAPKQALLGLRKL